MSSNIENKTPWILVISSMILLFLFVGYWNFSSYLGEKKKLADDVQIQLQLAYTEIKDSELIYFIRTRLSEDDENLGLLDSISIFFDTAPSLPASKIKFQSNLTKEKGLRYSDGDTTFILDIEYDTNHTIPQNIDIAGNELTVIATSHVNTLLNTKSEIDESDSCIIDLQLKKFSVPGEPESTRGEFRYFSDNKMDSITNGDSFPSRFGKTVWNEFDSVLNPFRFFDHTTNGAKASFTKTYTLLETKLKENNLPSKFEVVANPDQEIKGMNVAYETSGFGLTDLTIDLQDYQLFILKKMTPTLLFSLFLLGIITLAFWTLLKNWTKERRLALVKNEFINNMTHELKTPIATVGVALEAISNFDLVQEKEKTKEYLDMSRSEINRLSLLVDKVLNIAVFDSSKSPISSEEVNLKKILEDNILAYKLQLDRAGATLKFNNNTTTSMINGDSLHLSNVAHNMIDNAIKYTTENPEIEITLMEDADQYVLNFSDNGIGIPKAYQDKVFDRFFRVPMNDKHDVKGHGLGLNYVQNVVHAHGGSISVKSTENEGSTFTITLPKKRIDA